MENANMRSANVVGILMSYSGVSESTQMFVDASHYQPSTFICCFIPSLNLLLSCCCCFHNTRKNTFHYTFVCFNYVISSSTSSSWTVEHSNNRLPQLESSTSDVVKVVKFEEPFTCHLPRIFLIFFIIFNYLAWHKPLKLNWNLL